MVQVRAQMKLFVVDAGIVSSSVDLWYIRSIALQFPEKLGTLRAGNMIHFFLRRKCRLWDDHFSFFLRLYIIDKVKVFPFT